MTAKKLLGISILFVFLFSFALAVEVTDVTPIDNSVQIIAGINAKLTDLANQIESQRTDFANFQNNAFTKSDLQTLYDNVVNIQRQANLDQLTSIIVLVACCFCIFFILIGKNMLPQHRKEDKIYTSKENLRLNKENEKLIKIIEKRGYVSESNGVKAIADTVNLPKEKKGWFKSKVKPTLPLSPLPVEKELAPFELKQEFNAGNSKWREELAKAKMRVDILEELQNNGEAK